MNTLLSILIVFTCLIIIVSVLLQPSKGNVAFGGSSNSVFGGAGATPFLFRLTMAAGAFIMVTSLYLSRSRIQEARSSLINSSMVPQASAPAAANTVPSVPTVPLTTPEPTQAQPTK